MGVFGTAAPSVIGSLKVTSVFGQKKFLGTKNVIVIRHVR
jgi:hypothetical protein